jgi:hypothetical protein
MESQRLMSRVLGWTGLSGWAIGLGLATSWLVRQTDGHYSGAVIAVACVILMRRIIATMGLPELTRHTPGHPRNVQRPPLGQESLSR